MKQRARIINGQYGQLPFDLPVLEDAHSVQMALMQVMQMVLLRRIDNKTAGILLSALRSAAANVRSMRLESHRATDVVIDRDTVHLTAMDGPQWFEEDFDEEEESEEEDGEEVNEEEEEGEEDQGEGEEEAAEVEAADGDGDKEVKDQPEVRAQEEVKTPEEKVDAQGSVEALVVTKKPVRSVLEDLRKRLVICPGEDAVVAMRRLIATMDEMERSG